MFFSGPSFPSLLFIFIKRSNTIILIRVVYEAGKIQNKDNLITALHSNQAFKYTFEQTTSNGCVKTEYFACVSSNDTSTQCIKIAGGVRTRLLRAPSLLLHIIFIFFNFIRCVVVVVVVIDLLQRISFE